MAESAAQRTGPASKAETSAVYAAGVVQGIVLVTFPAASTIFTDPSEYDLSSTQYAGLFVPQVLTAIAAALLGANLSGRFGTKRVYLAGLLAGELSTIYALGAAVAAVMGACSFAVAARPPSPASLHPVPG